MKVITGIFSDLDSTALAVAKLRSVIGDDKINVLTPASSKKEIEEIPTDTGMPPVGGPLGATLGGALGLASAVAIPGVGLVSAIGVAWSLALGTVGGVTGWIVGDRADHSLTGGIPTEELFFYEEAIRDGHSVIIVFAADAKEVDRVRAIFDEVAATGIDAARATWWLGLREAEWADWRAEHGEQTQFEAIESDYLRGFTTALRPDFRDLRFEVAQKRIPKSEIKAEHIEAFEKGYARGLKYLQRVRPARPEKTNEEGAS